MNDLMFWIKMGSIWSNQDIEIHPTKIPKKYSKNISKYSEYLRYVKKTFKCQLKISFVYRYIFWECSILYIPYIFCKILIFLKILNQVICESVFKIHLGAQFWLTSWMKCCAPFIHSLLSDSCLRVNALCRDSLSAKMCIVRSLAIFVKYIKNILNILSTFIHSVTIILFFRNIGYIGNTNRTFWEYLALAGGNSTVHAWESLRRITKFLI